MVSDDRIFNFMSNRFVSIVRSKDIAKVCWCTENISLGDILRCQVMIDSSDSVVSFFNSKYGFSRFKMSDGICVTCELLKLKK